MNLALQIQHGASCKPERLQVGIKCNMAQIIVVVSASEWANKSFVDHATGGRKVRERAAGVGELIFRRAFTSFVVFAF